MKTINFVVLAAHSRCGAMTITAPTPQTAARLYREACLEQGAGTIWVWHERDYHAEASLRPDPIEYSVTELGKEANA